MRKKTYILILLLQSFWLFAQWDQELIPLDDEIYTLVEQRYRQTGRVPATAVRPWSRAEARWLVKDLPLPGDEKTELLNRIEGKKPVLYREENLAVAIPLRASVDLQGNFVFWHQGDELELYPGYRTARDRNSFLEVPLSFSLLDKVYMEMNLNFREDLNTDWDSPENFTNLPLDYYDVDLTFPQRAYISTGGKNWNFMLGRVLQNWGQGQTGNLLLADNSYFHDQARFKAFFNNFNFTWAFLSLESRLSERQKDYYVEKEILEEGESFKGEKYLLLHDFEFRPFKCLRVGLTEGLIIGGTDIELTPSHFNPMMLFHNWFTNTDGWGNAIHMAELDFSFGKQMLYFQAGLDQYQCNAEKKYYPSTALEPSAFGYLLGINRSDRLGSGNLSLSLEGAWTMPYLYTSNGYYTNHSINEYHASSKNFIKNWPLGYNYGNNALVFALLGDYQIPGEWDISAGMRVIIKGEKDTDTEYPLNTPDSSPGKELWPSGNIWTRDILTLKGSKQFNDHFNMEIGTHCIYQENPDPLHEENNGDRYKTKLFSAEPWFTISWQL